MMSGSLTPARLKYMMYYEFADKEVSLHFVDCFFQHIEFYTKFDLAV